MNSFPAHLLALIPFLAISGLRAADGGNPLGNSPSDHSIGLPSRGTAFASKSANATETVSSDESLKAIAALGSKFATDSKITELGWDEKRLDAFLDGVRSAYRGKPYPFGEDAKKAYREMAVKLREFEGHQREVEFAQPGRLKQFFKEIKKRFGLDQSDSGLCYGFKGGTGGLRPRLEDTVVVSYVATAADGETRLPLLSADHTRVKVADLLPGLAEGVQMMTLDSQAMLVLPPALSYGQGEWPQGVDHGTPLFFQVVLHEIVSPGTPATAR